MTVKLIIPSPRSSLRKSHLQKLTLLPFLGMQAILNRQIHLEGIFFVLIYQSKFVKWYMIVSLSYRNK